MSEPIKLPPLPLAFSKCTAPEQGEWLTYCDIQMEQYARLAVEQNTEALRAKLADRKAMLESVQALWGEDCTKLREAREELTRLHAECDALRAELAALRGEG